MKKSLVVLLIIAIAVSSVFAGGSSESGKKSDKVELVFWHRTSDNFTNEIAAFEAMNPDIKIISEAVGTDYDDLYTKYMTAIASNSLPNIGIVGQRHGIPQMYDSGKLLPIEDYLTESEISDIMPEFWGRFTYGGKKVALPYANSIPMMYYNADLFEQYGLDVPTSLDEVVAAAKVLTLDTDNDGRTDIYGLNFNSDTPWYIQPWAWDNGAKVIVSDKEASVDNEGYKKTFEAMQKMVHVDKSMPANQHSTSLDDFKNGYVAMFLTSCANLTQLQSGINGKFTLGVADFPGDYTIIGGNALGLFDSSPEKIEASLKFIRYLISLEGSLSNIEKGYLPIRLSFINSPEIEEMLSSEPNRQVCFDSIARVYGQPVNVADSTIWLETIDILSKVEANPTANVDALLAGFQKDVNQFYADYYL